jgi:hypothetical protein
MSIWPSEGNNQPSIFNVCSKYDLMRFSDANDEGARLLFFLPPLFLVIHLDILYKAATICTVSSREKKIKRRRRPRGEYLSSAPAQLKHELTFLRVYSSVRCAQLTKMTLHKKKGKNR